jgi:hypothetical protein
VTLARRCYRCDERPARYAARVAYDLAPVYLLCVECAAELRGYGDIITIREGTS